MEIETRPATTLRVKRFRRSRGLRRRETIAGYLFLYNARFGLLNYLIGLVGIHAHDWLGDPHTAMPAIAAMAVWKGLGWTMTVYLAALRAVPGHLYEAAQMDGANKRQQFRYITW